MNVVFKYRPPVLEQLVHIRTHEHARLLSVQFQEALLTFWFLVDTDQPLYNRFFRVYGTGWEIEEDMVLMRHVATLQQWDSNLVWHVFEQRGGLLA